MGQFFYFVSSLFPYRSTENRATIDVFIGMFCTPNKAFKQLFYPKYVSSSRNRRTIYLFVDEDCEGLQISYFLGKLVQNKMH